MRRSSIVPVALVLVVGGCIASGIALVLPVPTLLAAMLTLAGAALLVSGRVGRTWRMRWPLGIGGGVLSMWLVGLAILTLVSSHAQRVQREDQARARSQAARARVESLEAEAPNRIAQAQRELEQAEGAIARLDPGPMQRATEQLAPLSTLQPTPTGYAEVQQQITALNQQLGRAGANRYLQEADGHAEARRWAELRAALDHAKPYVDALGPGGDEFRARARGLEQRAQPFLAASAAMESAQAAMDATHGDAVAAESAYDGALAALDAISGEALEGNARTVRRLRSRLTRARRHNHRAAERLGRARAARAVQRRLCGNAPTLSSWDGELIGSERYLQATANDPDSIDVEHCTVPSLTVNTHHCWVTTCNVRGRNGFGALILNRMQFEVANDRILSARNLH